MCMVTVVNRNEKTKKCYFVEGSKATVSAAIQQIVGSFDGIYVEDLIRKDLSGLLGMLSASRMQKTFEIPAPFVHKSKQYPDILQFKG